MFLVFAIVGESNPYTDDRSFKPSTTESVVDGLKLWSSVCVSSSYLPF